MRKLLALAVLLCAWTAPAQMSYWFTQWSKKPDAKTAQEFFMVPGAGIAFSYNTNHVIITANGIATSTNAIYSEFSTNWLGSNAMQTQITTISNQVVTSSNTSQTQITGLTNAFQTNAWHLNGNALGGPIPFLGSTDNQPLNFKVNNTSVGSFGTDGWLSLLATAKATNFATTVPKWVDLNVNYAFSVVGPTAPDLVSVTNPAAGSLIKALAFDNNDELFGTCQLPHTLAITNSGFPVFYTEPHVHFDTIGTLNSTHSNVTWRIEWEWADINGGWQRGTNQATMGITNNFTHYMLELGHITNNPPLNISAVFRCRLTRPASATQEYDSTPNSHTVILDAFDIHVPIGNTNAIGSSSDNAP